MKEYSTRKLTKFTFQPNCVSTLLSKTKTMYKQHILKSTITVRSIESVVRNFRRKSSNFCIFQFLGRKFFYQSSGRKTNIFKGFLHKNLRPIFKLDVFNF